MTGGWSQRQVQYVVKTAAPRFLGNFFCYSGPAEVCLINMFEIGVFPTVSPCGVKGAQNLLKCLSGELYRVQVPVYQCPHLLAFFCQWIS